MSAAEQVTDQPAPPAEQYVEQYVRARVVTDSPDAPRAIAVVLHWTDGRVHVTLPDGSDDWSFPRDLLERGLRAPATGGDIRIWPCGRVQAVMEFHAHHEATVVQFDVKALSRFLRRTYTTVAPVPASH